MQGIFYAIFVVAILVIIRWYIENERPGSNLEGDKGWLAMRKPGPRPKSQKPTWKSSAEAKDVRRPHENAK